MKSNLPNKIQELIKLGDEKYLSSNFNSALEYYKDIFLSLEDPSLYDEIVEHLKNIKAYDLAISFFEELIKIHPEYSHPYWFIADINIRYLNNPKKGIAYLNKFMDKSKPSALVYEAIGNLYKGIDKYKDLEKQIKCFKKAAELKPDFKDAIREVAFAYSRAGDYEKASEWFKKIFDLGASPDDYFAYSTRRLQLMDFKEGWKYYEYRFLVENSGLRLYPKTDKPKWEGQNIFGKTILVQYEQGFGDTIMFSRYIEQLKPFAGKIIFRTRNELVDLFKNSIKDIEIIGNSTTTEELSFDYHVPLISLPYLLNAQIDNIPLKTGYIKATKNKTEFYRKEFFNNDKFKIGICWMGSATGIQARNIPLKVFHPLTKLKNVQIYSLQKESEELNSLSKSINIVDLGRTFNDFSDTAAAIENLDLVISSDNAVLNLAASMGKKSFLLLNKHSDWRWFLDEEKTPWYDSVTIFKKQKESDSWKTLINRVVIALEKIL